jgi:hypothetical protein
MSTPSYAISYRTEMWSVLNNQCANCRDQARNSCFCVGTYGACVNRSLELSQSLRDGTFRRSSSKKFRRTVTLSVDLTCVTLGFRTTAKRFPSGARS